jgi:collagenase-like PrtC family protease
VEAVSESPEYRCAVGATYREALARALAGDGWLEARWWETLAAHSRLGLANGFAFGRSGMDYIGTEAHSTTEWRAR